MGNTVHFPLVFASSGSPLGGTYQDWRENARRNWRDIAAEHRRQAWAERQAAMAADQHPVGAHA